ncbi:hypothetical protein LOC68_27415 [Blastopirellula sp. JC732]|uniref:Uncharacterized protein n=1 Tax=Blastopirellula sediminis TaxID=2894196 RepID=A0A9X1SJL9_9BACT|nr:hypothetical protein [Blastopirellula sediminis]MCC9604560.1 hypothetical protein [Blastopirellula sediminis]MCC9632141.1 hypothetical protein [Blastopirellula sediminis]
MRLWITAIALCLSGCVAPSVTKPLGTPLEQPSLEKLTGVWQMPNGDLIKIKNVERQLYFGVLQFDENERTFKAQTLEGIITTNADRKFLFVCGTGKTDEYFFSEVTQLGDDVITLRSPDPETFRQGVKEGKISGEIVTEKFREKEYERARIDADEDAFFAFLAEKGSDACFPPSSEQTYRRLKDSSSP